MQLYELNNKIQVVTEKIPYLHSVSIGLWIHTGSRFEVGDENGISHFIEHMLFKGTKTKSAREIAATIDNVGGQLNAFTAKECTCFYVHLPDEHIEKGAELLSDMLHNSLFDDEAIKREQGVVCEEISMVEDTPDDLVHELIAKAFFKNHPLGQPILGTKQLVNSFDSNKIRSYMNKHYTTGNIVISVAGNFDENALKDLLTKHFSKGFPERQSREDSTVFTPQKMLLTQHKDNEQMNMCIAFPSVGMKQQDYYTMSVFNAVFGGAMSSRLFQVIREQNGLTYTVYSYPSAYTDSGMFIIYAGMSPNQSGKVLQLVKEEVKKAVEKGLSDQELQDAKEQVKGGFILGLESARSIMSRNGKCILLLDKVEPVENVLKLIDNINQDQVNAMLKQVFDFDKMCGAFVGKQEFFPKEEDFFAV